MLPFVRMFDYGNIAPLPSGIKDVQANETHVMILGHNGELWGYGYSTSGSLGTGYSVPSTSIDWYKSNISGVKSFSSNMTESTVALLDDGRVMVCGTSLADKFGAPNIPTTNLDWVDVTDHIPQEVISAGIKQIMNHERYVAILTENNLIYSPSLSIGNTSTIIDGIWRKNTVGDIEVERIVGLAQPVKCFIQDRSGYVYGIGINGYTIDASNTPMTTYTKIGTEVFTDFALSNSGAHSVGILQSGLSVYSGSLHNSFNRTFKPAGSGILKVSTMSVSVIGFDATAMYGDYGQNQLPIAYSSNLASTVVVEIRDVPPGTNTTDLRFVCGNVNRNVYILYTSSDGTNSLYSVGPNVGQTNLLRANFVKIDLPISLMS